MNLSNAVSSFLAVKKFETAPNTFDWYRRMLIPLDEMGSMCVKEFDITHLRELRINLFNKKEKWGKQRPSVEGGYSVYTIRGYIRAWQAFCKWMFEEEITQRNVASRLKAPPEPRHEPYGLTDAELDHLLLVAQQKCSLRDYALLLCFLVSGARRAGITNITLGDIDWFSGRVTVREKGRGGLGVTRTIYLTKDVLSVIQAYLDQTPIWIRPSAEKDRLWVGRKGPISDGRISHIMNDIGQKANMRVYCHGLRHTFARLFLLNGGELAMLSQILGHSSIVITANYYARYADAEKRRSHQKYNPLADHVGNLKHIIMKQTIRFDTQKHNNLT